MEGNYLYKDLSYRIIGICMEIHREYKNGHNERIYHKVLEEKLKINKINFISKQKIFVYSKDTGAKIGSYEPDFVVDDKIILELKVKPINLNQFEIQLLEYLKTSKYEVGYLMNFGQPSLYFRRLIYTNDKKPYIKSIKKSV